MLSAAVAQTVLLVAKPCVLGMEAGNSLRAAQPKGKKRPRGNASKASSEAGVEAKTKQRRKGGIKAKAKAPAAKAPAAAADDPRVEQLLKPIVTLRNYMTVKKEQQDGGQQLVSAPSGPAARSATTVPAAKGTSATCHGCCSIHAEERSCCSCRRVCSPGTRIGPCRKAQIVDAIFAQSQARPIRRTSI